MGWDHRGGFGVGRPNPADTPGGIPEEQTWPLDLLIAALVAIVLGWVYVRLDPDDPNLWTNAKTYWVITPALGLLLSFLSRSISNRMLRRSVQFGIVSSVFLHLLLAVWAINYVVFTPYMADAMTGVKPQRSPIRRTVPEYLFKNRQQTHTAVDWTEPVPTQTTSPVLPQEPRRLPPLKETRPRLELPQPETRQTEIEVANLKRRETAQPSQPQPSPSPSQLSRRRAESNPGGGETEATPDVPELSQPIATSSPQLAPEPTRRRRNRRSDDSSTPDLALPNPTVTATDRPAPASVMKRDRSGVPTVGASDAPRSRRRRRDTRTVDAIAGSTPTVASVAVAASAETATMSLQPTPLRRDRSSRETPEMSPTDRGESGLGMSFNPLAETVPLDRTASRDPGIPTLQDLATGGRDGGTRAAGRQNQTAMDLGGPVEVPERQSGGGPGESDTNVAASSLELAPSDFSRRRRSRGGPGEGPMIADVDLTAPEGPIGLSDRPDMTPGLVPSADVPEELAALDLSNERRRAADFGGPMTPAGAKVTAVESFSRRVMRTAGGAAQTPAGQVGPDTEEAIERGLAYLASSQKSDGSWSLQGHGDAVALRSDTAATGLALLAFQGAGYTHRQHQYADTVARGIQWLVDHQRSNGNLYVPENEISDRNVALYSHGIAALAMSEAYGMTQDEEILPAAQGALDYIIDTQHRKLGGWRYTPQVSADTSVTGWMMMALKSGQLSGLEVPQETYDGIVRWLDAAQIASDRADRYRYNPFAPDTSAQRHGRIPTPTMTAVGMLMRMYSGWQRDHPAMQSAAKYLLNYRPSMGDADNPQRDAYYWYYATQVMFHMGGDIWEKWNRSLNPLLLESQLVDGPFSGSWDPVVPVEDRWSYHGGRMYVTTMNLLNLEVYYRHLPIYEDTAK